MSDKMRAQPFDVLLNWILKEFEENQSIFGIPRALFYTPKKDSPYAVQEIFGHYLATPIGPAAGPHTQLAQNIVCAWLSGGRFIELKTVQILDELEIPRPCIDMEDEGYNVEWSQELKLEQSANEYIKAWVLIHILHRLLGFEGEVPLGTVFNMSVGYNLAGIQSPPMTRFMERMVDASEEIAQIQDILRRQFPQFADIEIPTRLTNNVTLSTMHGCPPDEIERIVRYLLEERGLHTTVKLNPTLLGKEMVMHILHERLGFREIYIPDAVFEHDLQYDRAVKLITVLKQVAAERHLTFGVKLSNTLAMANHKGLLPGDDMYMSGRALYPITMNLFYKLAREFNGDLNVSYSAGADAINVATILACGACPVTAVTDLLKPGGYSRLLQFLENLEQAMRERGVSSLEELARDKIANLEKAANEALENPRYKKSYHPYGLPKVESGLALFDCITAPCKAQCAVRQDVPEYAWWIAQGDCDRALEVILSRNPLPGVTGYICTHLCQTRCTRNNYDQPVAIRALKRIAAEKGRVTVNAKASSQQAAAPDRRRVAVIGSGPSGLAAAYFLALNGVQVTIYEAKDKPGGMLRIAPAFRLPASVVQEDIDRIIRMGVKIELSHPITVPPEELLQQGFDAVYIACGFAKDAPLDIEGIDAQGVFFALDFLERVALGERVNLGAKVLVIGGGNTAMDAARTARRLTGKPVTVVYRRTQHEMPASEEEKEAFFAEGNTLMELASPTRVIVRNGHVAGLECVRNRLGEPGTDGRREPIRIEGSEFVIEADSIIVAIGQRPDITFLDGSSLSLRKDGTIFVDPETGYGYASTGHIYAGGDVTRGPATVIEACADGQCAAEAICAELGIEFSRLPARIAEFSTADILQIKRARARKEAQHKPETLPPTWRNNFDLVERTLTEAAARSEAARCLQCSTLCDKCVEVCPNRANYAYVISPMQTALPTFVCRNGALVVKGEMLFIVQQERQIIHIDDFCNECGNCATFCVHQGKPYREKPRLFLNEGDFALEESNAFYIGRDDKGWMIKRRESRRESRLLIAEGSDEAIFDNDWLTLTFSVPALRVKAMALKHGFPGEFWPVSAAEMYVILRGVTASLPFLPLGRG